MTNLTIDRLAELEGQLSHPHILQVRKAAAGKSIPEYFAMLEQEVALTDAAIEAMLTKKSEPLPNL